MMNQGKKISLIILSLLVMSISAVASGHGKEAHMEKKMRYQAVPMQKATIVQEGEAKNYCPVCGMTLPMFYKTNHAASHKGHNKQYCSVHCMIEDKEVNGKELSAEKVVDTKSLKFVDAKKAYYVVGSSKPGTMTMKSKYGFENKADAKAFQEANGGELKSYDEVYAEVSKGMQAEKEMIAKRQKKMQMMGEKVYNKMCKKTDKKFSSVADAKTFVTKNKLCGELKGKKLQAVGIYLGRR